MSNYNFESENQLELDLIRQLTTKESQWTYRDDIKNEDDLWNNIKEKIENINKGELGNKKLSDSEFSQIKSQLSFSNFYNASKWLAGENGKARVEVMMDDASLGKKHLLVIDNNQICGGVNTYEIINQCEVKKRFNRDPDSRFDVTLLINGLPLIAIELKKRNNSYYEAFNQIQKYIDQSKFTGVFSAIQMFVVSNGTETKYIASNNKLNKVFLTGWNDVNNKPVNDLMSFADQVLTIPAAHKMISDYSVLDDQKKSLILLRSYQVHAIEAVRQAVQNNKSGYIWHTTGSGKTLTSYNVAKNLARTKVIDKVVFLVDRIDLDLQTSSSFSAYSTNDSIDVDDTDNVYELEKELRQPGDVLITTIQKLNRLINKFNSEEENKNILKIKNQQYAFVVDECHRAVSAEKKQALDKFFKHALWYGFTGTPIFKENSKGAKGELARTTEELYGERLHQYTVKEAIHDNAVLGFQVEYQSTFDEAEEIDDILAQKGIDYENLTLSEKEQSLPNEIFESDEHIDSVVNRIVNKSKEKFNLRAADTDSYEAILTVSSIDIAKKYYEKFKEVKVNDKIVKLKPDFPKVAITYSLDISDNEDDTQENIEIMQNVLADYNKMFNTNYNVSNLDAYNKNLNERLARKINRYKDNREEQLDIVIVVDRLLTGFDAPCCSTLFIDRKPPTPHNLIQAFSRTNRKYDNNKKYGQIVTFRTPAYFKECVDFALKLYSNGGENYVLAPSYDESFEKLVDSYNKLKELVPSPNDINDLTEQDKLIFIKRFQKFDNAYTNIKFYDEYEKNNIEDYLRIIPDELNEYMSKYQNVIEEVKKDIEEKETSDFDINYELCTLRKEEISYDYIIKLIQSIIPQEKDSNINISESLNDEIQTYIDSIVERNPKFAEVMQDFWNDIKNNLDNYANCNIISELNKKIDNIENKYFSNICEEYKLDLDDVKYRTSQYPIDGEGVIDCLETNFESYQNSGGEIATKWKYRKEAKAKLLELIQQEIMPLRNK